MMIDELLISESTQIDFKISLEETTPKSWLKSISAFSNTHGGIILFGIRDIDKAKIGLKDVSKASAKISELINEKIVPAPDYELIPLREENFDFIQIQVFQGKTPPYYYKNEGTRIAYCRQGDQSIQAPDHILHGLILKGMHKSFDELPSQYSLDQMSFTLLSSTYFKETHKTFNMDKDLVSFGLTTDKGIVTNAGVLFSDTGLLRQSRIFCTRWTGRGKGSLAVDAMDDEEYSGCSIITLLNNADLFVRNNSKTKWTIEGMKRVERHEYPIDSVREALVNAIIHRDYSIIGSEVHVDIFEDRLEIMSPGGMFDGTLIQQLDINNVPSKRRNPIIADLFGRIGYMDRRGSGLRRILESYRDCPFKPIFRSNQSDFTVIMPNMLGYVEEKPTQFTLKEVQVLAILKNNPKASYTSISQQLNIPRVTIKRTMETMVKQKIIKRNGPSRGGFWEIL
jgi:ATP-dependent DNA helicase RecG